MTGGGNGPHFLAYCMRPGASRSPRTGERFQRGELMMDYRASVAAVGLFFGLAISTPVLAQPIALLGPWTGFYLGAHIGGAFDPNHLSFTDQSAAQDLAFASDNGDRFLGGLHGGYDWDAGSVLIGVEGDV